MASSKLPPANNCDLKDNIAQSLLCAFSEHENPKLLLAYSGGLDSSVLLHLLVQCQALVPFELSVMHVNHGLSPHANEWADFCKATCEQLKVSCQVVTVNVDQSLGLGVEAAARQARYKALHSVESDWIALAHHQNDQAETLLLQLARGAGLKGLSAMAAINEKQKLLRPLLNITRAELEAYAKANAINWVEDESNQSLDYDRNIMRHQVLPILQKQYPAIINNLARSASHQAEAAGLLNDLAIIDAVPALESTERTYQKLSLSALKKLTEARANNLLRFWLSSADIQMPSTTHLAQLLTQLLNAKNDSAINVKVAESLVVNTYQGFAYLNPKASAPPVFEVIWRGETEIPISDYFQLRFEKTVGKGLSLQKLQGKKLVVKSRAGGERLRPNPNRPTKSVKQLLQEAQTPPWERDFYPLIYIDDMPVGLAGSVFQGDFSAATNEPSLSINLTIKPS